MEVIVISPEHPFPQETEWVQRMMEAGLNRFHLRRTFDSAEAQQHYLRFFDKRHYEKISVHQHQEIALAEGIKHVHIKADERKQNKLVDYWQHSSTSFHSIDELKQEGPLFQYCFISPVFESLSKPGYQGNPSLLGSAKHISIPIYALGGITLHTVAVLKGQGFKGVGAIGAIWQNNPLEQFLRLKEACHDL